MRPHRHTFDEGNIHFRPAVIWQFGVLTAVVRVFCGPGTLRDFEIARELLPCDGLGAPVTARFIGDGSTDWTLAEVEHGEWGADAPRDEGDAVRRAMFTIGIIPRRITKEDDQYDWTK